MTNCLETSPDRRLIGPYCGKNAGYSCNGDYEGSGANEKDGNTFSILPSVLSIFSRTQKSYRPRVLHEFQNTGRGIARMAKSVLGPVLVTRVGEVSRHMRLFTYMRLQPKMM